ncbi:MAG TPA: C-GCAxxG-C-C family protein [archaeon]|nr:C-GCAxxG-C-C family protein [archaeon]
MRKVEEAVLFFQEGHNCAQSIVAAYGPELGLEKNLAFRVTQGLGGGMGRLAGVCGAVSGAILVIGLKTVHSEGIPDREVKAKTYETVREFVARFKERNSSIECREILGCDISTPEGYKTAREEKLLDNRCPKFVEDAADILEELFP